MLASGYAEMTTPSEIKAAMDRVASVLEARPSQGRATNSAESQVVQGLKCECHVGEFSFTADAKATMGGEDSAPSPGGYARAAVASCLAMGYAAIFARRELAVTSIKVRVETDSDSRGAVCLDPDLAGFHALRYSVAVESSANTDDIRDAIEAADRCSAVLQSFIRPVPVEREISIRPVDQAAE